MYSSCVAAALIATLGQSLGFPVGRGGFALVESLIVAGIIIIRLALLVACIQAALKCSRLSSASTALPPKLLNDLNSILRC
jgi:hypothetical protein